MVDQNDLDYEKFEDPVVFRIYPESDEVVLTPTFEIGKLLREHVGFTYGENYDIIKDIETKEDYFAFDAATVETSKEEIKEKVETILDNYNKPSLESVKKMYADEFSEDEIEEIKEQIHREGDAKIEYIEE